MHSSYGAIFEGENGYKCFACGVAYGLSALHAKLTGKEVSKDTFVVPLKSSKARQIPYWRKHADSYLKTYTAHSKRYTAWMDYKSIPENVVDKYDLGVGILPQSRCRDLRLIVPIIQNNNVVMLRGRRISGDGAKWASSGGVSPKDILLPFWERVTSDILMIVENPVDAILVNEFSIYCSPLLV